MNKRLADLMAVMVIADEAGSQKDDAKHMAYLRLALQHCQSLIGDIVSDIERVVILSAAETRQPVEEMRLIGRPLDEVEGELLRHSLARNNGNREKTAKELGIGERTIYRLLKKHGLGDQVVTA